MGRHDETADRARAPDIPADWRRWGVLLAAVLGTALAYMSDDMRNLAIPSVARDLDATAAGVQWILNAYYLPLVAFVLVAGSVGDIIGHRRVFRAGLLLFCVGAVLCASAFHVGVLIAGRALQGVAAAILLAAGLALVTCAGAVAFAMTGFDQQDHPHENPPPSRCSRSAICLRGLPLPTRRHRAGGALVAALRAVLPRRRRVARRTRHPSRPRQHLPLGAALHAAAG